MLFVRIRYLRDSKGDSHHSGFSAKLEAGLAPKAIQCDGASYGDIHDDRLIWTIGDEGISIRDLRTTNDESFFESKTMSLDTSHIMPAKTSRPYVWILLRGDILMTTLIVDGNLEQKQRLARNWNGY